MAETNQVLPSPTLINVFLGQIGGVAAHVCDARELHVYLKNGDKFADWIKGRIEQGGFTENQDFSCLSVNTETQRKDGQKGVSKRTDYHLTLNTGKHLGMMERNDQGKAIRDYFIRKEAEALAAAGEFVLSSPTYVHPETLIPIEQQTLSEIVHNKAAPYGENAGKALAEIWSRLHRKFRVSKYSQLDRTLLSNAIVYVSAMTLRGAAPDALPSPANDKLQLGFDHSEEGAALAQLAMHSLIGKDFILRICAMPDGRAFHSVQPVLDSAFLISMKDIPGLLAKSGLVAVKKSTIDELALLAA
jgi:phage anti-repressor protein